MTWKIFLYLCFCPVLSYKFLFSSKNHYTNHYIRDIRRCTMQGIEISITWFKALAWLQNINKISSGSIGKVFKIYHMMYKRHKQWKIKWVLLQFILLYMMFDSYILVLLSIHICQGRLCVCPGRLLRAWALLGQSVLT